MFKCSNMQGQRSCLHLHSQRSMYSIYPHGSSRAASAHSCQANHRVPCLKKERFCRERAAWRRACQLSRYIAKVVPHANSAACCCHNTVAFSWTSDGLKEDLPDTEMKQTFSLFGCQQQVHCSSMTQSSLAWLTSFFSRLRSCPAVRFQKLIALPKAPALEGEARAPVRVRSMSCML